MEFLKRWRNFNEYTRSHKTRKQSKATSSHQKKEVGAIPENGATHTGRTTWRRIQTPTQAGILIKMNNREWAKKAAKRLAEWEEVQPEYMEELVTLFAEYEAEVREECIDVLHNEGTHIIRERDAFDLEKLMRKL